MAVTAYHFIARLPDKKWAAAHYEKRNCEAERQRRQRNASRQIGHHQSLQH